MPTVSTQASNRTVLRVSRAGTSTGAVGDVVPGSRFPFVSEPDPAPAGRVTGGGMRPFFRRWMAAGLLLGAAVLATLYIANAIAVNQLTQDIASLEGERDGVRTENERLRAELLRLMAVDRIGSIASTRLGLTQPTTPQRDLRTDGAPGSARAHAAPPESTTGSGTSGNPQASALSGTDRAAGAAAARRRQRTDESSNRPTGQ